MGSWGISAFETDAGLDAVELIRMNLPGNGKLKLNDIIEKLKEDDWSAPSDVKNGEAHSSPMVLAEIVVKFLDNDVASLDRDWVTDENKFDAITSFTASRESIHWLRDYLFDTLKYAIKNEKSDNGKAWGGWVKEKNWVLWQKHMADLVKRLDGLLDSQGSQIVLLSEEEQNNASAMKQDIN